MKAESKTQPLPPPTPRSSQPFRKLFDETIRESPPQGPHAPAASTSATAPQVAASVSAPRAAAPVAAPLPAAALAGVPRRDHLGNVTGVAVQGTPIARIALVTATAAEVAQGARARVEGEARRLVDVRAEHQVTAHQALEARGEDLQDARLGRRERLVELITQELVSAFEDGGSPAANDQPHLEPPAPAPALTGLAAASPAPPAGGPADAASERAAQAIALIERIDVFLTQGHRPSLELTLNNSLGARVEIERLGPGEVTVKLVGHRGPPAPEAVSQIRDELRARGLKVAAMSVA